MASGRDTVVATVAQSLCPECFLSTIGTPAVHPGVFDALDALVVCAAALHTVDAAGPSGVDTHGWQRLCISYHVASDELYGVIALFARQLCTTILSPHILRDASSLLWTSPQEFSLLEFVRWCNGLWQSQPSMLFGM